MRQTLLLLAALMAFAACSRTQAPEAPVVMTSTWTLPASNPADGDGGVSDFYTAPPIEAAVGGVIPLTKQPGYLVRSERLETDKSLAGASLAERILYVSSNGLGGTDPVLVSGAVFLPKGEKPADGWPLIAWAHGTVGVADVCAPSWNTRSERDATYLNHWLSQGYAVVASDYQGLGVAGGHPYLATRPAAYSVLDSIRAVQASPDYGLSRKVVLVGQSQGGGAAFATAGAAETYAPELDIRGTVATGTPYFTTTSAPVERDPTRVEGVFAYTLYILHLVHQADPAFDPDAILTEQAKPVFALTRTACLGEVWTEVEQATLSQALAFTADPTPTVSKYFGLMAYDTLKAKGPVFMGTGGKDHDVPPEGQARLVADACKAGSVIEHHVYKDLDHSGTVNGSLAGSTPFVKKAFTGAAIAGNCAK